MTNYPLTTIEDFTDFANRCNPNARRAVKTFYDLISDPKSLKRIINKRPNSGSWIDLGRVSGRISTDDLEHNVQLTLEATGLGKNGIDLSLSITYPRLKHDDPNSYEGVKFSTTLLCKTGDCTSSSSFNPKPTHKEEIEFDTYLNICNNIFSRVDPNYIRE